MSVYVKPKVVEEKSLLRDLVYAEAVVEGDCTTWAKNIEIKDNEAKLT